MKAEHCTADSLLMKLRELRFSLLERASYRVCRSNVRRQRREGLSNEIRHVVIKGLNYLEAKKVCDQYEGWLRKKYPGKSSWYCGVVVVEMEPFRHDEIQEVAEILGVESGSFHVKESGPGQGLRIEVNHDLLKKLNKRERPERFNRDSSNKIIA